MAVTAVAMRRDGVVEALGSSDHLDALYEVPGETESAKDISSNFFCFVV